MIRASPLSIFIRNNALIAPGIGLRVINCEFLYCYSKRPESFKYSYDVSGVPSDFSGDLPRGRVSTYELTWKPIFRCELHELM